MADAGALSIFEVLFIVRYEEELYIVQPVVTESGEIAIPLTGWVRLFDEDNSSSDEEQLAFSPL